MSEQEKQDGVADIAIVGMAGRFPASRDVHELWRNVQGGVEMVRFFSDEELLEAGVEPAVFNDPNYVRAHGYMEGIDQFDAGFFEINPREAEVTDPQIRLFLETCWEALEDAAIDPDRYPGAIGVFAGASNNAYVFDNLITNPKVIEAVGYTQAALGNHTDFVATRASYKLNLRGPSVTVQTACSTSLVSTHMACQSLLSGESDVVLTGGVCVTVLKKAGYTFVEGGTNTSDGHVRTFDARGDGMLGGNGAAVVVLKRLEDAVADGDTIRAIIKGTAINNDGIDKVTFTAPSVNGQCQVILDALDVADVDPATITMVEAHGTATPLGDPIEIAALTQAWRARTNGVGYCRIGSLKSNAGHMDIAAGVSGLIKTTLSLQHKQIPPTLHFETPNPEIDFDSSPFVVNTELHEWDTDQLPRRAAVSSFGMGGTNAHAILEEAPELGETSGSRARQLFLLSARSHAALDGATAKLAEHLEAHGELDAADVAFTLQVGRKSFEERRAVVAADSAEAVEALRALDKKRSLSATCTQRDRPVAFLFTGQGAQYPNMMRGLYEAEPTFKAELDRCCELLEPLLGRDLRELILPAAGAEERAGDELALTQNTQPALFAVEWALAKVWQEWGVEPDAMIGHSIGEYTAACLAGVFSLEDALKLVAARGRLIGALPEGGAMMAVHVEEAELTPLLAAQLSIAAVNAPGLCVVSGPEPAVAALEEALGAKEISTRRLHTSHAFHSSLMDPILADFRQVVSEVTLSAPERPLVSCSTGTWLSAEEATDPEYWVRHVRGAVRFADGVRTLAGGSGRLLLEVGPGQTLASLAGLCVGGDANTPIVNSVRHPNEDGDDLAFLLRALGEVWAHGVEVDWEEGFYARETRRRLPLPTYAWDHRRYWVEPGDGSASAAPPRVRKNADLARWFYVPSWERSAPARVLTAAEGDPNGAWVIFLDQSGLGEALAESVRKTGVPVFTVSSGDAFAKLSDETFVIDPARADDYRSVLSAVAAAGRVPTEVVYLPGVDPAPRASAAERQAIVEQLFHAPLGLAQALSSTMSGTRADGGVRVGVVTTGLFDVLGGDLVCPEKAVALGPVKGMSGELEGILARAIDVDVPAEGLTAPAFVEALRAELASDSRDLVVAHRDGRRWVQTYRPVELGEVKPPQVREGAVVLVTGGLGGIGLALSEHLARTAHAKLVLVGRSPLPDPSAYDAWLSEHGEEDATSRKILAVRRLEELGAEVLTAAADVADLEGMRAVLAAARARFGAVSGLIHGAGIAGAGIIDLKTRDVAEAVLAPKVGGTWVLDELLGEDELDFAVMCSSISSVLVDVGQVDYTAANAYLDAWAQHRSEATRTHALAVNWDAWSEVGMAVNTDVPEGMRAARDENLRLGVSPDEGREALDRMLAAGLSQVVVSPRDLLQRIDEQLAGLAPEPEDGALEGAAAENGEASGRPVHARPNLSVEFVEPSTETERDVAVLWADLLGIDKVGVDDNFFELGGNSLVMMQLNVRLRSAFGVSLPIRALFETPEVGSLAERIESLRVLARAADVEETADSEEETEEFTL
jgi:acyl transferase domain-containing protein/acyl carrier protein